MSTITTAAAIAATFLITLIAAGSIHSNYQRYASEPVYMSHEQALQMCDDAGLIYDYEAEGTTTFELCYE